MGLFRKKKIEKKKEEKGKEKRTEEKKVEKMDKVVKVKPAKSAKTEVRRFSDVHGVLKRPLVTEKISNMGMYNQYAFCVSSKANKIQIKKAVETYYKVKPVRVNIVNVRGKSVRWGRTQGKTKGWKKAIVTLRAGDKIELYEGV